MDSLLGYGSSPEDEASEPQQRQKDGVKAQGAVDNTETAQDADGAQARVGGSGGLAPVAKRQKLDKKGPSLLPNPLALLAASSEQELRDLAVAVPPVQAPNGRGSFPLAFPRVVGNFATVVMLPVPGLDKQLDALYRKLRRLLPDLEPMAGEPPPETSAAATGGGPRHPAAESLPVQRGYHVSLSRCVPIRQPQIAPLTQALEAQMAPAVASPFRVSLKGLRSFANDEGTRSFVSAMVDEGARQVCSLVRSVDAAFAVHSLPAFYEVPLPHVSVGWLLGNQRDRIDAALSRLQANEENGGDVKAPQGLSDGTAGNDGCTGPVLCSWQATRAVCVVGKWEYEVWCPGGKAPRRR